MSDAHARDLIRNDTESNFFVEAGAGSGKTTILVERLLNMIKEGKAEVDKIAAITFTNKAAAEMSSRLRAKLREAVGNEKREGTPEHTRLVHALENIDSCFIGTIHSFCSSLLRKRPVEAGVDPRFIEMDERQSREYLEGFWYRELHRISEDDPERFSNIKRFAFRIEELKAAFKTLVDNPDVAVAAEKADEPDFSKARRKVTVFLARVRKNMPDIRPGEKCPFLAVCRDAERQRKFYHLNTTLGFYLWIKNNLKKINKDKPTQKWWVNKETAIHDFEYYKTILYPDVIEKVLTAWQEYAYPFVIEFLEPSVRRFEEERTVAGRLNFQDLLMKTARMLRSNYDVRSYFADMYKVLLVDEFQDTDPVQAEIMFYLTGKGDGGKHWTELKPGPGSLFVVGDPKQSIYRFRRADITIFNTVKKLIQRSGGKVVDLTQNFRSVKKIGEFVDNMFITVFPDTADKYSPAFKKCEAGRSGVTGTCSGVVKLCIPKKGKREEKCRCEAVAVTNFILDAVAGGNLKVDNGPGSARPAQWGDFLLISYYTGALHFYPPVFDKAGIPYLIDGAKDMADSRVLRILVCVLKAVCDKEDRIHETAVLRSVLFGISDTGLFNFKHGIRCPETEQIEHARAMLSRFRELRDILPVSSLIRKIVKDTGLQQFSLMSGEEEKHAGNIEKYISYVEDNEKKGKTLLPEAVEVLENLLEASQEESLNLNPLRPDAVRIMNLHKVKGLEAPVVILIDSSHTPRPVQPEMHVQRQMQASRGYMPIIVPVTTYYKETIALPMGWEYYCSEEVKFLEAEKERMLYVAATRARDLLVVCDSGNKNNSWAPFLAGIDDDMMIDVMHDRLDERYIRKRSEPEKQDLQHYLETRQKVLERLHEPSFSDVSPSRLKSLAALETVERTSSDKGTSWGNVIHAILEKEAKRGPAERKVFAENILVEYERSPDEANEVLDLIETVKQSEIWQRSEKADQRYAELPVSCRLDDCSIPDIAVPVFVQGFIDLVFKEGQEWVIVDYKTDHVQEKDLPVLTGIYRAQVSLYKTAFEKITGETVKESLIYYVSMGRVESLENV